jgi:hypothetical protein
MGWLTNIQRSELSPREEIDRLLTVQQAGGSQRVLLSALVAMREYYAAVELTVPGKPRQVWAAMWLVHFGRGDERGTWGYKDMDETMGPYYHRCPAKILDLLTEPLNEIAAEWREKCRETIASRGKAQGLRVGQCIRLREPLRFTNGYALDRFEVVPHPRGRGVAFYHGGIRYQLSLRALMSVGYTVEGTTPNVTKEAQLSL